MRDILEKYGSFLAALTLLAATLIAYWPVQGFDFVQYDDSVYVFKNDHVSRGLTWEGFVWAFTSTGASNWQPLTWLSLMLDGSLFGLNAGGYHWTNLCVHLVNALLLFWVFQKMTRDRGKSFLVAALFALHPLHVESVAWVAERKDVLCCCFWLLTVVAYLFYVNRPTTGRYLPVALAFSLALMAKPMAVTLPFVLFLFDYWPLGRFPGRSRDSRYAPAEGTPAGWIRTASVTRLIAEKAPLLLISGAASVVAYTLQRRSGAIVPVDVLPLASRMANAIISYVAYIAKTMWPLNLAVFYPHPGAWPMTEVTLAAAFLTAVSLFVMSRFRSHPFLFVGWTLYLGTLVPVIGLVQIGSQAMADRYTYIPLLGIFIMLAWGVPTLLGGWRPRRIILICVVAVLLSLLTMGTRFQVYHWRNSYTLFNHAAAVAKDNYIADAALGKLLLEEGRSEEAADLFTKAVRIKPIYKEAYDGEGLALAGQGKYSQAELSYRTALKIRPDYADARYHLGLVLVTMGRYGEAEVHYRNALQSCPQRADIHNDLGIVLSRQGRREEALGEFREAIRLQPDHAGAWNNMAMVLEAQGRSEDAIRSFREALRREPQLANAHYQLAVLLKRGGQVEESLWHYQQAVRINSAFRSWNRQ